jgi:hypothetical protein
MDEASYLYVYFDHFSGTLYCTAHPYQHRYLPALRETLSRNAYIAVRPAVCEVLAILGTL